MKTETNSILSGSIAGVLGALCCVTPLVLVLLGLSSLSGAMALSGNLAQNYRWTLFIPLAAIFLISAIYLHIKRREGYCNIKTIKKYKRYVIGTIVFAIIVWVLLLYLIIPGIFKLLGG